MKIKVVGGILVKTFLNSPSLLLQIKQGSGICEWIPNPLNKLPFPPLIPEFPIPLTKHPQSFGMEGLDSRKFHVKRTSS